MTSVSAPPALEARALTQRYGEQTVLDQASLTLWPGEVVAVMGPSGSGKSTLLHLLGGLDQPTGGEVWWSGQRSDILDTQQRAQKRAQQLGLIFQHHYLLEDLTVAQNVLVPALLCGSASEHALGLLSEVGLHERAHELPQVLSGGERQRVAVARALATRPAVVLADEPTGSLDRANADRVAALLLSLARAHRTAVLLVTHDPALAAQADRQLSLLDGRLS